MVEIQLLIQKALSTLIPISQILSMLYLGRRHNCHFIYIVKLSFMLASHTLCLTHARTHRLRNNSRLHYSVVVIIARKRSDGA